MTYDQSFTRANSRGAAAHNVPGHIVVIGAGFGGLATAIRLQASGHKVTVVEARERVGGRAYQLQDAGFTFDMGPSLITAPHLLEALWATAGRRLADDVHLVPLDPFYRIYARDGRYFDYGGGPEDDEAEVAKFEPRDVEGLRAFLKATERIYHRAFDDLAGQPFDKLSTFLGVIPQLARLGAQRSVYRVVSRYFRDPFLRMVFSFHPLFIGGNPLRASAIYSIVPYLERQGGVHFALGGMYRLIEAMERLFIDLGGTIVCGDPVKQILVVDGRAAGVVTERGRHYQARAVVANSDVTTTQTRLLPSEYTPRSTRRRLQNYHYSMSCFLLYLGLNRQYDQLRHHTILMPDDYKQLLTEIFDGQGLPSDLALYLHAPTKTDPSMAPPGGESLYVLVPVPHLHRGIDWTSATDVLRDRVIHFLEHDFGLEQLEASIVTEHRFTPVDFQDQLGSWLGSAFSIEPTLFQSAYFRPHNRSRTVPGLYFVGAGTHPGAGIPGVLLSAEITSNLVNTDHPSPSTRGYASLNRSRIGTMSAGRWR
ncbi:MAG TPA: phytoene desaturase family protein [Nitrolancea sp.]|nr:phytoene desaturase family protein [Nitrolancea sp.]